MNATLGFLLLVLALVAAGCGGSDAARNQDQTGGSAGRDEPRWGLLPASCQGKVVSLELFERRLRQEGSLMVDVSFGRVLDDDQLHGFGLGGPGGDSDVASGHLDATGVATLCDSADVHQIQEQPEDFPTR